MTSMEGFRNVRAGKLNNDALSLAGIDGAVVFLALEDRGEHKVVENTVLKVEAYEGTISAWSLGVGVFGELFCARAVRLLTVWADGRERRQTFSTHSFASSSGLRPLILRRGAATIKSPLSSV
jgi:hypothetical protein